jgi:hypothetical protein
MPSPIKEVQQLLLEGGTERHQVFLTRSPVSTQHQQQRRLLLLVSDEPI